MRFIQTITLAAALVALTSCKRDAASADVQSLPPTTHGMDTAHNQTNVTTSTPTPTGGHDYTFLTHELFHIGGAHVSGAKDAKEQPYKDQWIDLMPDGTFKWGEHKAELYAGTWTYNNDSELLNLVPNPGSDAKPTEWKVMHNDNMVVLLGTRKHGNNNIQIQLIRSTSLPD